MGGFHPPLPLKSHFFLMLFYVYKISILVGNNAEKSFLLVAIAVPIFTIGLNGGNLTEEYANLYIIISFYISGNIRIFRISTAEIWIYILAAIGGLCYV